MGAMRICLILAVAMSALLPRTARAQDTAEEVFVSVFVNNIPMVDTQANSFALDAYIRFVWTDPSLDPSKSVEIANPFNGWRSRLTRLDDSPRRLPDGRYASVLRYEGMFAAPLLLTDYPFEQLMLRAAIQDRGGEGRRIVYRPGDMPATVSEDVTIRAYQVGTPALTAIGVPVFGATGPGTLTRAELVIPLSRNGAVFGVKVLMPILVVVVMGLLALLLDRELAAAQVALLATTLLSLIVLQLSTAPKANYLTMLDTVFVLGRLLLAIGLLRVVYTHFRERAGLPPSSRQADARIALSLIGVLVFGTIALVIGHLVT